MLFNVLKNQTEKNPLNFSHVDLQAERNTGPGNLWKKQKGWPVQQVRL